MSRFLFKYRYNHHDPRNLWNIWNQHYTLAKYDCGFARNNAVHDNTVYRTIMIRVKLALYPINSPVLFKYTRHNSDTICSQKFSSLIRDISFWQGSLDVNSVRREIITSRIVSEISRQFSSIDNNLIVQEYNFFQQLP